MESGSGIDGDARPSGDGGAPLLYMKGGVGDLLQHAAFALANRPHGVRYVAASHFAGAAGVLAALGIALERCFVYADDAELAQAEDTIARLGQVAPCPRAQYFAAPPFAHPPSPFAGSALPVIGVHLGGSRYSIAKQEQAGLATKALPAALVSRLADTPINLLLFGSAPEVEALALAETERLRFVCFPDIGASLAHVALCAAVVASDSVIKTMSSMLRIPTIVWLANYRDDVRDRTFIRPYVADGVMSTFRYSTLAYPAELDRGIAATEASLRKLIGGA
jgi:hypothetical protein